MGNFSLPEVFKIVQCHEPETADAIDSTSDIISCKNLKKLWVVFHHYSGGGDLDFVVTWYECTDVAGGTTAIITATSPIWYNTDTSAADLLTRATDAATFTIDTTLQKDQIWILEWDPALFSAGYDCFHIVTTGGHASNHCSIMYFGLPRYQSDVVVSAITD